MFYHIIWVFIDFLLFPTLTGLNSQFYMEFFVLICVKNIQNSNTFTVHGTQEDAVPSPSSNTQVRMIGVNVMKSKTVNSTAYSTEM